jgi:eukaryotic-like serine/threonine-protein kinase
MASRQRAERWRAVGPYLDQALELDPGERASFLAALRERDATIAAEVAAALEMQDALLAERFLADAPEAPPRASLEGLVLGAYTLREPIGQGGMGTVWRAERSDGRYRGVAAVKLLSPSLLGPEGEDGFRREGSILARLRHPHIAQLIDAGVSPTGQPYLVLEHVDGQRIDRHCDGRALGVAARVRLFLDVVDAVAHAHANLVVHRDLKPSNVMVGADGRVKLLDFGIAKLLEPEPGEEAALTHGGGSRLTPDYAAPEQLAGGTVTTATDVYALGVLLYLLLTGRSPHGSATSPAELVRAIVEVEPPPASQAAAPPQRSALRGDLDNILARALKKDPAQRYASAQALGDDLRRHLAHQPVAAAADSLVYRARKLVRRNRVGAAAAAAVLLALAAGAAGVAWQARVARRERDEARAQLVRATAANDFMKVLLNVAAPAGRRFEVGELLEHGAGLIDRQFAGDAAMRADLLATVGTILVSAEHYDRAAPLLDRAVAAARLAGDPVLRARAQCARAMLHVAQAEREAGEALMADAMAALSDDPRQAAARAACLTHRSQFGYYYEDAAAMVRDAEEAQALLDRTAVPSQVVRIEAMSAGAYGHYLARRTTRADQEYARLWARLEAAGIERTSIGAGVLGNWSVVHFGGDISRAEALSRRAVDIRRSSESTGSVSPTATHNHAGALLRLGRYEEARRLFEETIATAAARQEHRIRLDAMIELAELHVERGDLPAAAALIARLERPEDAPHFTPGRRILLAYARARLALARGQHETARAGFADVVKGFDERKWAIAQTSLALVHMSEAERALGRSEEALASARRAIALSETFVEAGSPSYLVGLARMEEAAVLLACGQAGPAQESYRRALDHLTRTLGSDHPAAAAARQALAASS